MSNLLATQKLIRKSMATDQIERWLQPDPHRVYRDLALDWAGILGSLIVVTWIQTWWIYGISFLVIGFCQYALFILGHDALHNSLHPNKLVTFRPSWLESIIFSPHNMNYHAEHHLLPTVPYYNFITCPKFTNLLNLEQK